MYLRQDSTKKGKSIFLTEKFFPLEWTIGHSKSFGIWCRNGLSLSIKRIAHATDSKEDIYLVSKPPKLPLKHFSFVLNRTNRSALYSSAFNKVCVEYSQGKLMDDNLPSRNSYPGLIGIGLGSGLRSLSKNSHLHKFCKVVPKSYVSLDFLEPLNCKGLFTTHAITECPIITMMFSSIWHLAIHFLNSFKEGLRIALSVRNSGPGLTGIGLAPELRTLFL